MKTFFLTIGTIWAMISSLQAAPSSLLGSEWYVPAESLEGNIALVDRISGIARLGRMETDGTMQWSSVPTGIRDVTDVGSSGNPVGNQYLLVTSSDSNRVAMLNFGYVFGGMKSLGAMQGIGPVGVCEGADGENIMVASALNGGSQFARMELMQQVSFSPSVLSTLSHSRTSLRMEPMEDPASGLKVAVHAYRHSPGNVGFALAAQNGASITDRFIVALTGDVSFVTDVLGTTGARMILAYLPGSTMCRQLTLSQPITVTSSYAYHGTSVFPFAVSSLIPVPASGAGAMTNGLIAISADGTQAAWLQINAAGDILATGHTFSAAPGRFLNGVLPVEGLGIIVTESTTLGGASAFFTAKQWNGSNWIDTDTGALPDTAETEKSLASVLFYSANPFVDDSAVVLGSQYLPEWSSLSFYPDPFPSTIRQEAFASTTAGLQSVSMASLSPPPWTNYVMTNQVEESLSILPLSGGVAQASPDLTINPASGSYRSTVTCSALYNEDKYDLYVSDATSATAPWTLWDGPRAVGYTTSLRFYLRDKVSGSIGEIVRRDYVLAADVLNGLDSDRDGVPDYVEMGKGLDPAAGADTDGDGVSDLDEIVAGSNPADDSSRPASPLGLPSGDGFALAAMAYNHAGAAAATGEFLTASRLSGARLSYEPIVSPAPALTGGVTRYARLTSNVGIPRSSLLVLSAPQFFDVTTGARSGREIIRMVPAEPLPALAVTYAPTGTSLNGDVSGWTAAAVAAASTYQAIPSLTRLDPADTAVSVLMEKLIHHGLSQIRDVAEPLEPLDQFSAFAARTKDVGRYQLQQTDIDALISSGYDFRLAQGIALTAKTGMTALANGLYQFHATHYVEPTTPGAVALPLPLDVLRLVLRGAALPASYTGAVTPAIITAAVSAHNAAFAQADQAFRPTAQWSLEIVASLERGIYRRASDQQQVILLHGNGERFYLDQGLGLAAGTTFLVTGYTDPAAVDGRSAMEVTSVVLQSAPVASDRDADGNLLDDEWEQYFFGATGQDPYAEVGSSGYSLLQYFLDGIDPRGTEVPAGPVALLAPSSPVIAASPSGGYTVDFTFPAAYADRFVFQVEASTSLSADSFATMPGIVIAQTTGDHFRATIPAAASTEPKKFFRVTVGLVE